MENIIEFISEMLKDTGRGLKGFLKAQVILMGITFLILSISLSVLKVPYAILIALVISLVDVLPVVGSGLIIVPWTIINFIMGNSYLGKALAIIYIILIITRQILEPKILGKAIGVRPLYTFLATIIGSLVLGPIGLIVGPLLAVLVNSIIKTKKEIESRKQLL